MLRSRPGAGSARRHDVLVRMHILQGLRGTGPQGPLPELRRRAGAPPDPPRRQAREVSGVDRAKGEAAGVRGGVTRAPLIPAKAGIQTFLPYPVALGPFRGNERSYSALGCQSG